jgi:hypothetical protein
MNEAIVKHLWGIKTPEDPPLTYALRLYKYARFLEWLGQIQSSLSGAENGLLDLKKIEQSNLVANWRYVGVRTVIIDHIVGSYVYSDQFDAFFYPKASAQKSRWISTAAARMEGSNVPLVDLIKINDRYIIQEGIHRVSVSRVLGEVVIKGYITLWDINDDLSIPIPRSSYHPIMQGSTSPSLGVR